MKKLHVFADFRGGLNVDSLPEYVAENELIQADNVEFMPLGGLRKRFGVNKDRSSSFTNDATQYFEWSRDNGEITEMAIVGGSIGHITTPSSYSFQPRYNTGKEHVNHFILRDKLYYVTGTSFREYDGVTDKAVTPSGEQDNDLSGVKRCKFALRHPKSQRIFFAGDSQNTSALYYSEPGDPSYVKGTSVMFPSTGDGPITGLALFVDAVVVFFQHSLWIWRGIDPDVDAVWHKLPTNEGTIAPRTICQAPTGLLYLGAKGIINLSSSIIGLNAEVEPGKEAVFNTSKDKVENIIRDIKYPEKACAAYDVRNGLYFLAYADNESTGSNNKILVMDEYGRYTRWTGLTVNDLHYKLSGEMAFLMPRHIGRQTEGAYVDILPSGSSQAVQSVIKTPKYALDSRIQKKVVTRYDVILKGDVAGSKTNVKFDIDSETVDTKVFTATGKEMEVRKTLLREAGNNASIEVKHTTAQEFVLHGLAVEAKVVNSYGKVM